MAPAVVAPIKKTPDIIDIVKERGDEGMKEKGDKEMREKEKEDEEVKEIEDNGVREKGIEEFAFCWKTMFNLVFENVPTIYLPFKESIPQIENHIITFIVKNEIQKEHFEAKKREVLEYLRIHYDEKIEDIVVEIDEQLLDTKKIIYDAKDKYQNFKEQNEEFETSIQILELTIKD